MANLAIVPIESEPWAQWAYLVWKRDHDGSAIVFDPGYEPEKILDAAGRHQVRIAAILLTHGHHDHLAGVGRIKQAYPEAPIVVGRNEEHLLADPWANLSAWSGPEVTAPPPDILVDEGELVTWAGLTFEVREIPGHSPGSVVYIFTPEQPSVVFGGDVLFAGGVGRTDFPGGSSRTLFEGIRSKLFTLPDETRIFPGHGPPTTIGAEKRGNPFVGGASGDLRA